MNQKAVKGYPKYILYSDGRVYSERSQRFLNPVKQKNGYLYISIGGKTRRLHRLIATAFIPNIESLPAVNHKNGIKHDNRVENLEWCTNSDNIKHAFRTGLKKINSENVHSAKLNWHKVNEIRKLYATGKFKQGNLAMLYGVDTTSINKIVNNRIWKRG